MKNHPKTYENVFSTDRPGNPNTVSLDKIDIDGIETGEYLSLFKNFLKDFYDDLFLQCVKLSWLRRKFTYDGVKPVIPIYNNSGRLQGQFVKIMRRYIGHDIQLITKGGFFSKLETHFFDILFPEFEEENPFKNPDYYKFPFENISFEYLTLVYQLDDKIELLKEADKQKMSYAIFIDYVLNHVLTENEELGRDRYSLSQKLNRNVPYFFTDSDKCFIAKKGEKRL